MSNGETTTAGLSDSLVDNLALPLEPVRTIWYFPLSETSLGQSTANTWVEENQTHNHLGATQFTRYANQAGRKFEKTSNYWNTGNLSY